jgi:serine/threonine-protein kinase
LTTAGTIAGVILGTAAYMSPEQAHGRPADRRADVWAFGCLLYEMVGGRVAFTGESVSDTLASVLKLEPDWSSVGAVPGRIEQLLRRCMVKDPRRRLQSIGEARIVLEDVIAGRDSGEMTVRAGVSAVRPGRGGALPWIVVAVMAVVLGATLWSGWKSRTETAPPMRIKLSPGSGEPLREDEGASAVISHDGRRLAFVSAGTAASQLWVRDLDRLEPIEMPDTHGAGSPFFSHDGEEIGFFAGGHLKKVPVRGGATTTLTSARSARGGSWCSDGSIVFTPDVRSGLSILRPGTSVPENLTELNTDHAPEERSHRWPQCLRDEQSVVFMVQMSGEDYDDGTIEIVSLIDGTRKTLHRGGAYPRIVDGYLLFARKGTLYAARYDSARQELTGRPEPVVDDLMSRTGNQAAGDGSAQYDLSPAGHLVFRSGWEAASQYPLAWVGRDGQIEIAVEKEGIYSDPRISPDGKKIALADVTGSNNDVWVYDLERGSSSRLTFAGGTHYFPAWTPDSEYVTYSRDLGGSTGVFMKRVDGAGDEVRLIEPSATPLVGGQSIALINPCSWSPDGKALALHSMTASGGWDLHLLRLEEGKDPGQAEPYLATPYDEVFPEFSPDGRLVAYQSNESGGWQVYVRTYPDTGGRWQVSVDGGQYPRWSRDGREIFFRVGRSVVVASVDREGEGVGFGKPRELFEGNFLDLYPFAAYDVTGDGQRFLMFPGTSSSTDDPGEVILVLDWLKELRSLVP